MYIPFGWCGMFRDEFTGKYHTHFRDFDPLNNRWLSPDPAGYMDGLNLYAAYMGVNRIDLYGLGIFSWLNKHMETVGQAQILNSQMQMEASRAQVEAMIDAAYFVSDSYINVKTAITNEGHYSERSTAYQKNGIFDQMEMMRDLAAQDGRGAFIQDAYASSWAVASVFGATNIKNAVEQQAIVFDGSQVGCVNLTAAESTEQFIFGSFKVVGVIGTAYGLNCVYNTAMRGIGTIRGLPGYMHARGTSQLHKVRSLTKGNSGVHWNNGWSTADGKFASPQGPGRAGAAAEELVWSSIEAKPGWEVIRGRIHVRDTTGQLRVYDGAAISPKNRMIGLEVKSGTGTKTALQKTFDSRLNSNHTNTANGVGKSIEYEILRALEIKR